MKRRGKPRDTKVTGASNSNASRSQAGSADDSSGPVVRQQGVAGTMPDWRMCAPKYIPKGGAATHPQPIAAIWKVDPVARSSEFSRNI